MEDGGLIMMGDLPRKNDAFSLKKMVSLLRVTYPKIECDSTSPVESPFCRTSKIRAASAGDFSLSFCFDLIRWSRHLVFN